jgi:hypothetical protein
MSEKSSNLSAKGRAAGARPTFRPMVEALEDRLLPSFSMGAHQTLTLSQQAALRINLQDVIVSGSAVVQNQSDQAAPLVRFHRIEAGPVTTQGRPTESISLNYAKIEPLQPMGGGTMALSYESQDDKHKDIHLLSMEGGTTAVSYNLKAQKEGLAIAAMAPAGGTPVTSPGQTSLQAPDGGTMVLIVVRKAGGKEQ